MNLQQRDKQQKNSTPRQIKLQKLKGPLNASLILLLQDPIVIIASPQMCSGDPCRPRTLDGGRLENVSRPRKTISYNTFF